MRNLRLPEGFLIEGALVTDAVEIAAVLAANSAEPSLFLVSARDVARHFSDYLVARDESGRIVGCIGLYRNRPDLAQIGSLAVIPQYHDTGLGPQLISAAIRQAAATGVKRLWGATMKPAYWRRLGCRKISRWQLPPSVLLRQVGKILRQPVRRIPGALFGKHTFVEFRL